jgi:hypothetical protein
MQRWQIVRSVRLQPDQPSYGGLRSGSKPDTTFDLRDEPVHAAEEIELGREQIALRVERAAATPTSCWVVLGPDTAARLGAP